MNNEQGTPFIFYLTLEDSLPETFYRFHSFFNDLGLMLVPVKIDQLQLLTASTEQTQVIVISSVTTSREYKLFNEKIRNLLKYVVKSRRLTFLQLSSFDKLNDTRNYAIYKSYFFLRYPLNGRTLAKKISRFYELKSAQSLKWPGGKRAGVHGIAA